MSREFTSSISGIHLVEPLLQEDLDKLSSGFCLSFWIWPDSGEVTDIKIHQPAEPKSKKWYKAASVFAKRRVFVW